MKKIILKATENLTINELGLQIRALSMKMDKAPNSFSDDNTLMLKYCITLYYIKSITKEMIEKADMPQNELAQKVGISKAMISEYKKGSALPSLPVFWMIYLHCSDKVDLNKDYVSEIMKK